MLKYRSQFFKDLTVPFYGANRAGATVSQSLRDFFWLHGALRREPGEHRDDDVRGVDLEESAQRFARVAATESVGAERDEGPALGDPATSTRDIRPMCPCPCPPLLRTSFLSSGT